MAIISHVFEWSLAGSAHAVGLAYNCKYITILVSYNINLCYHHTLHLGYDPVVRTFLASSQSLKFFSLQSHFQGFEWSCTFFNDCNGISTSGAREVSWLLSSIIDSTDSPKFLNASLSIRRIRQLETSMVLRLRRGGNWYLDKLKYNLYVMKYLLSIAVTTRHIKLLGNNL